MRSILTNTRNVDHVRFNLTLIRHAETSANADGVIQGLIDTELSNIGYLQSKALGRHLQYHRFSHIYSSDLKRASETARQIHLLNRVSICEIKFDSLLRERMYGIAQGQTRQWLHELAKENGVPYNHFTPPGAETIIQVRERAITLFRKLCQELLIKFGTKQGPSLSYSISTENLLLNQQIFQNSKQKRSVSTEYSSTKPCYLSIDSALDLCSLSSNQQSISSTSSYFSRNNSFEKQRNLIPNLLHPPSEDHFSDLDILVISHGAVIRELIKYFAYDLQTDIGEHLDVIHELAPNTSITRFQVTYSRSEEPIPIATLQLIDYHNKNHLINHEFNLDVTNKCSL